MKLPPLIRKTLDATSLPWRVEQGGHHQKLFVADHLAGILPRGTSDAGQRTLLNTRAQIRRIAREKTEESQP